MTTISGDILAPRQPTQSANAAVSAVAAAQPQIVNVTDRDGARNDRRQSGKNERGLDFRAVLSTATFSDLTDATSIANDQPFKPTPQRSTRVPKLEPEVLSGAEATQLYNAAKAVGARADVSAQFRAATTSYAKSFFSVEGTYARPGEALELSI